MIFFLRQVSVKAGRFVFYFFKLTRIRFYFGKGFESTAINCVYNIRPVAVMQLLMFNVYCKQVPISKIFINKAK